MPCSIWIPAQGADRFPLILLMGISLAAAGVWAETPDDYVNRLAACPRVAQRMADTAGFRSAINCRRPGNSGLME
uniref:Uncharacterized protein n=1 Tax=Candidatus Kentrum sp. DK TaxID=2126562 RepID=A0A450S4K4_9GAMM|nr:MAG: hypothetical protein BECKDK2373B_GA0170837_101411 [Candidatus Kentron sp. DK]